VSYADACVGRILDAIEHSPDRDNTIVILWGDHGWQLGHKERWEKFSLWKQGTQSPLIIRGPGVTLGECARAVSFLDIAPTVLQMVGASVPAELQGVSLTPLLRNPSAPRTVPAVVTYLPGNNSVVLDHWNYIRYADGSEELYDHRSDPAEYRNLIKEPAASAIVAQLRPHLPKPAAADLKKNAPSTQ
jgi:arylsulfatase A-like enzyme